MNDEQFFDLAMKVIARQSTDAERAELDALLAREPQRSAEFAQLQAYVRVAKGALPLVAATQATAGELPAYARGRLQTKVRQTLGGHRPPLQEKASEFAWGWRRIFGVVAATVVVVLVVLPMFRAPSAPTIQVAMLDGAGAVRGASEDAAALLKQAWQTTTVHSFANASDVQDWLNEEADAATVKVIYDPAAGEVRVLGKWNGKVLNKTFLVERDLAATVTQVKDYIAKLK
jgi:anti-sigma factor RsiW